MASSSSSTSSSSSATAAMMNGGGNNNASGRSSSSLVSSKAGPVKPDPSSVGLPQNPTRTTTTFRPQDSGGSSAATTPSVAAPPPPAMMAGRPAQLMQQEQQRQRQSSSSNGPTSPNSSATGSEGPTPPPVQFGPPPPGVLAGPPMSIPPGARHVVCKMPSCAVPGMGTMAAMGGVQPGPIAAPCAFAHPMSPISENSTASSVPNSESANHGAASQQQQQQKQQQQQQQQGGFNSSCQQCLAERAAAEAGRVFPSSSGTLGTSSEGNDAMGQPPRTDVSGIEFTSLPSPDNCNFDEEPSRPRRRSSAASGGLDPGPPARTYECELWCRQTSRMLAGCLSVCCLAAGYAAAGGLLFMAVESRAAESAQGGGGGEVHAVMSSAAAVASRNASSVITLDVLPASARSEVERARAETVEKLWQVTERMNILYPENWTRRAAEEMLWFQDRLVQAFAREFRELRSQASKQPDLASSSSHGLAPATLHPVPPRKWTFARGLLYAVSLLTTVGEQSERYVAVIYALLLVLRRMIGVTETSIKIPVLPFAHPPESRESSPLSPFEGDPPSPPTSLIAELRYAVGSAPLVFTLH